MSRTKNRTAAHKRKRVTVPGFNLSDIAWWRRGRNKAGVPVRMGSKKPTTRHKLRRRK